MIWVSPGISTMPGGWICGDGHAAIVRRSSVREHRPGGRYRPRAGQRRVVDPSSGAPGQGRRCSASPSGPRTDGSPGPRWDVVRSQVTPPVHRSAGRCPSRYRAASAERTKACGVGSGSGSGITGTPRGGRFSRFADPRGPGRLQAQRPGCRCPGGARNREDRPDLLGQARRTPRPDGWTTCRPSRSTPPKDTRARRARGRPPRADRPGVPRAARHHPGPGRARARAGRGRAPTAAVDGFDFDAVTDDLLPSWTLDLG